MTQADARRTRPDDATDPSHDPHRDTPVHREGSPAGDATGAVIALHGRGSSAGDILGLVETVAPFALARWAPEAAGSTWYPHSFLVPVENNQPYLDSALAKIDRIVAELVAASISHDRIALLGFSQGACLALEYAARHARRWGAVIGLSGGLIGPPGTPRDYPGSLAGTPVFLGCSDTDAHIPLERVHESTAVFRAMGASVTERIYPGMGHTVNRAEITIVREMLSSLASPAGRADAR
ncbi:MAG: dienelactone hydrolase family protein [Chloroflexia bacterium]|nr:dienelactone hydrolase family protein [Chloroflexia bacterium]MDQ3513636.1 dienelactone hydrolase family protein [Chloroflexota bacterium]